MKHEQPTTIATIFKINDILTLLSQLRDTEQDETGPGDSRSDVADARQSQTGLAQLEGHEGRRTKDEGQRVRPTLLTLSK